MTLTVAERQFKVQVHSTAGSISSSLDSFMAHPEWFIVPPMYLRIEMLPGLPKLTIDCIITEEQEKICKEFHITHEQAKKIWHNWVWEKYPAKHMKTVDEALAKSDQELVQKARESFQLELAAGHEIHNHEDWWLLKNVGLTYQLEFKKVDSDDFNRCYTFKNLGFNGEKFFTALSEFYNNVEITVECDEEKDKIVKRIYKGGQSNVCQV